MRAVIFIAMIMTRVSCNSSSDIDDSIVQIMRADYHAYENAWSVYFSKKQGYENEVFVVQICQPPCVSSVLFAENHLDCAALTSSINDTGWYNGYVALHVHNFSSVCDLLRWRSGQFQQYVSRVLDKSEHVSFIRLRPPRELVVFNDEQMLGKWSKLVSSEVFSLTVRVTQIAPLAGVFVVHRTVLTIQLQKPAQSLLTLSVQNPCTAVGFAAPTNGNVQSVIVDGQQRCVWNCRGDLIRKPYNSVPPTREQLNLSKYRCEQMPLLWTATLFEFKLEVDVPSPDSDYAQIIYDSLDHLAAAIEQNLTTTQGESPTVLLAIPNSLYHPRSFEQWLRNLHSSSCLVSDCGAISELNNPHFFYQRRRLLVISQQFTDVLVEGVCIRQDFSGSTTNHLQLVTDLRSSIVETELNASSVFNSLRDVDFSKIIFVRKVHTAAPSSSVKYDDNILIEEASASWVGGAIGIIVAVIFALFVGSRMLK